MSDIEFRGWASQYERDMHFAAELGKRAAQFENRPGLQQGTHKVRHDFRKGILSRYVPEPGADDWERERILNARMSLHQAYYARGAVTLALPAQSDEIPGFEVVQTVEVSGEEIEMPPATAELIAA